MMKFIKKIINFFAGKSSGEMPVEEMPEASEIPEVPAQGSSKKKLWKFIIQTLIVSVRILGPKSPHPQCD